MRNPLYIYEYFLMMTYVNILLNKKYTKKLLNKMKRSPDKYWIPSYKN
jgi:hypothetical protein